MPPPYSWSSRTGPGSMYHSTNERARAASANVITDCVARAIEVACVAVACLGRVIADEDSSSPLRKDHCGTTLEFIKTNGGATAVLFSCGGGPGP